MFVESVRYSANKVSEAINFHYYYYVYFILHNIKKYTESYMKIKLNEKNNKLHTQCITPYLKMIGVIIKETARFFVKNPLDSIH